jgi:hypothetical protein
MARALGTDDSVNSCDCCGKSNLKFTVAVQLDDGEVVHYGQVCAARNTGKSQPQINAEIKAEHARKCADALTELKSSPEYAALAAKFAQRPRDLFGRAAADFVRAESDAEFVKRQQIAAKFGIRAYEMHA